MLAMSLCSACAAAPEAIYDPDTRVAIRLDADIDRNGLIESRTYFAAGRPLRIEVDIDGDSRVDRWEYYGADGTLERLGSSSQADGREDTWLLQNGVEARLEISTRRDGVIDRREVQRDGVVRATEQDSPYFCRVVVKKPALSTEKTRLSYVSRHLMGPQLCDQTAKP